MFYLAFETGIFKLDMNSLFYSQRKFCRDGIQNLKAMLWAKFRTCVVARYSSLWIWDALSVFFYLDHLKANSHQKQLIFKEEAWLSNQGAGFACGCSGFKSHSDHCLDLSWVLPESYQPRFVNSQLVCLLPVGVFNCVMHVCVKTRRN